MELLFYSVVIYWFFFLMSGGCGKVFEGNANPNVQLMFYIGLGLTGLLVISAVIYDFIELVVHNKNNTQKKE